MFLKLFWTIYNDFVIIAFKADWINLLDNFVFLKSPNQATLVNSSIENSLDKKYINNWLNDLIPVMFETLSNLSKLISCWSILYTQKINYASSTLFYWNKMCSDLSEMALLEIKVWFKGRKHDIIQFISPKTIKTNVLLKISYS